MLKGNIDVSKLIKRIEADEHEHIDSFVLSSLVKMVHLLGVAFQRKVDRLRE